MKRQATAIGVLLLAAACRADSGPDGGATLACSQFSGVARDAADGLLTDDELRSKIQDVESDASVSDEPGVAESARRMLAAVTPPIDPAAYSGAVDDFVAACNAAVD